MDRPACLPLALLALALAAPHPASADSLSGRIRDPQGGVVAGAQLRLFDRTSGQVREAASTADGRYAFTGIPAGEYVFRDYYVSYSMGAQRRLSGNLSLQYGEFYNGEITSVGYSRGRIEVTPQFSFEPSISVNRVRLPDAEFTAPLAITRLTYTFNPRVFFSGLVQFNPTQEVVSTNLRLRWEYRPGSELFVVYNDQRDTVLVPDQRFPMLQNRAFVVKFTRLFRF